MTCPLCTHPQSRESWVGRTAYRGKTFTYVECLSCGSLYCDPMPDAEDLQEMYSSNYAEMFHGGENMGGAYGVAEVLKWLRQQGSGTFVDYGCGAGHLLVAAKAAGWQAVGIEFDQRLASSIAGKTGIPVLTTSDAMAGTADVLHLGDVVEHLTDTDRQMEQILSLLKPGGVLLAQGPLENNSNLFHFAISVSRRLRRNREIQMPPYHVLLATAAGQRRFFNRLGLRELQYTIREEAWPAPATITRAELAQSRALALYMLRRCSQICSAIRPQTWGNRYFYAGRK